MDDVAMMISAVPPRRLDGVTFFLFLKSSFERVDGREVSNTMAAREEGFRSGYR